MKKTIFLSYSSAQSDAATRIELALKGEGHSVFRDRSSLPPGESFDAQIRKAVETSEVFIFLISHESVTHGRYTLTELKFAEGTWGHPAGHVLPVMIEPTPIESIPEFLRAVTILEPSGDVAAEVVAAVARMTESSRHWLFRPQGVALLVAVVLLICAGVWQGIARHRARSDQSQRVATLVKQAQLQDGFANYQSAWNFLDQAAAVDPQSTDVIDAQERLAMDWLDNARGSQLTGNLKDIAEKVTPVLSRGAVAAKGERAADLLAHMGWADFLRSREGIGGLDPTQNYRRAIEIDPENVYAHTMWGFDILRRGGSMPEAKRHFAIALESGRKREYVRHMQISALLWINEPEQEDEAIRVANAIRSAGESMPVGTPERPDAWRLWNIYYSRLVNNNAKQQFFSALPPADHLATFRWLYPENDVPKDKLELYLYMLAQFRELNGDRADALALYQRLHKQLGSARGSLPDGVKEGIKRLSG
ncbi:MAG TPA: toll/interleukin-1 receptor domain-containing protein [Candidatus Binatia bacterium]